MKSIFLGAFVSVLALALASCASRNPRSGDGGSTGGGALPSPAEREITLLNGRDIAMLESGSRLQERLGESVWPGFARFKTAVVMIGDHGQVLMGARAENLPQYYRPYKGKLPSWSGPSYYSYERIGPDGGRLSPTEIKRDMIANAFSVEQTGRHYDESVFFVDTLQRFHMKGLKWSIEEWLSVYWHEVFHNFQSSDYRYDLNDADSYDFSKIQPLLSDADYLARVREEQKLVSAALKEKAVEAKRGLICEKIVPMRAARFRRANAKVPGGGAPKTELFYESSEGTARYVEEMMSLAAGKLSDAEIAPLAQGLDGFPGFTKFAKFKMATVEQLHVRVAHIGAKDRYYYQTGFALSLLLDQVQPGWKTKIFKTPSFFGGLLNEYCKPAGASKQDGASPRPTKIKTKRR